jgi:radical SAM protein with 4Fe4S-binding SPASM domain
MTCLHCRGGARNIDYEGELSPEEGRLLIDGLTAFGTPVLILTGGEPMARSDIFDLARYASSAGLRVAMAPCGPLLDAEAAGRLIDAGISRISLSLDGANAETHDAFRGVAGAFDVARRAMRHAADAGLPFQINTTVSKLNRDELPEILALAEEIGAAALDLFFLVPTGRGAALKDLALSPREHEEALRWVLQARSTAGCTVRVTCAPHFARIERQQPARQAAAPAPSAGTGHGHGRARTSAGCMAGRGFLFISHRGIVQPCGFLDVPCGDVRAARFDVAALCARSETLQALADPANLKGKCGRCEFRRVCGGCRARAYAATGDLLAEEPSCAYVPPAAGASR